MNRLSFLLLVVLAGVVLGCGKSETVVAPDGTKATVTKKGDGVDITVNGPDGGKIQIAGEGSASLPEGFPESVPVYPGAKIMASVKGKDSMMVTLTTADASKKVADFYNEKLKANGWTIEVTADIDGGHVVSAKKDALECNAAMNRSEDQTTITLVVK